MDLKNDSMDPVIEVTDLQTVFHTQDGTIHAVNGLSFSLQPGELLGVVGESGCGKSVTMMSLLKLLPIPPADIVSGTVRFEGRDLLKISDPELRAVRGGRIGFIFQDPMTSLNPVFTIGFQLMEPLREHLKLNKKQAFARAVELLELVGIPSAAARMKDFPHQFSGGMRQRLMIAIALACDPKLLIADEPTTALDVTVQAQILEIIRDLRHQIGMAIIWITHDLGVIAGIADRVAVMYGGFIVEYAPVETLFSKPGHPYTRALLETLPGIVDAEDHRLMSISGQAPNLVNKPVSCPFAPRCKFVFDRCHSENPQLADRGSGHRVACWWNMETNEAVDGR